MEDSIDSSNSSIESPILITSKKKIRNDSIPYGILANSYLGDILNDGKLDFASVFAESLYELLSFRFRTHGSANFVALGEEPLDDPEGDVSVRAGDKNELGRVGFDDGHLRWIGWLLVFVS